MSPDWIERVAELVADERTNAAIYERFVRLEREHRWLKICGGDDDPVRRLIVLGVDGLRCHAPLGPVHRPAHRLPFTPGREFPRGLHIPQIRARLDAQRTKVPRRAWKADLPIQ